MLYRTTLLRAFSASLMISVLTACGGGSGGGDGTTPPPTQQDTNTGGTGATVVDTGGTSGTGTTDGTTTTGTGSSTGTSSTGTDNTGATTGTGTTDNTGGTTNTGGTGTTTGTGNTGGNGSTGGTGTDTGGTGGGTGNTGGNTGGSTGSTAGASGVWDLAIPADFVKKLEDLNHVGIVDEWLPGRKILMIDHGTSIDVSTCIDNVNLPPTQLTQTKVAGTYETPASWTFSGFEVKPSVIRQSDGTFVLKLSLGGILKLADIPAQRGVLNNQFVLQGTGVVSIDSTNLTCAVKAAAADGSKTLNVVTWYENSFLYLTFPTVANVDHYDYAPDEVSLNSDPLYYLIKNTAIDSAQLDLSLYEPAKLKLDFDLLTKNDVQLHGVATLQENPL